MKINILLFIAAIGASTSFATFHQSPVTSHQSPVTARQSANFIHETLWRQVDSLISLGLPKSALAIVNSIYQQSLGGKDDPELVKAILYRIRLQSDFQENPAANAIRETEREIAISREPVTQILHSILGELYWNYLQQNQYRFMNRTQVVDIPSDSIETWDLTTLTYHIILSYRSSLSNEIILQSIPVERFYAILEKPDPDRTDPDSTSTAGLTLFDFLARRALGFFTGRDVRLAKSQQSFQVDNAAFFSQPSHFVSSPLQPKGMYARPGGGPFIPPGNDTLALPWYALRIYQSLAAFHLNDKDPENLINQELNRFSYVLRESTLPDKDSLYLEALKQFEQDYLGFSSSTDISYALAQKLMEEGTQYNPLISDDHKWDLRSAVEVCQKAIGLYPDATGSKNCKLLIRQILAPSLQITGEYAIIPGQPALISVSFKNVSDLNFRMLKTDPDLFQTTLSGLQKEVVFKYLAGLKVVDKWAIRLPSDGDHQEHRTEVKIPATEPGFYVLFSSVDSAFLNPEIPFTYQALWSSHISYIFQRDENGGISVYLLGRETGKPLKNLMVEAFSKTYDSRTRTYVTSKAGDYTSDESGYFTISPPGGTGIYSNLFLKIRDEHDLLITEPLYIYSVSKNPVRPVEQTRFFTDRAIYRPGQTIYFKGIILERAGDSTSLKPNKTTRVTLVDVNGQKIADQPFTTSAYGAFNGSFTAPIGVLLGEMRIFNESGSIGISVEEYKRPTFEVLFDPVEGNYKLGEPVAVVGKATGYAGNAIDGGLVNYRVVRSAHFPFWDRMWYCPVPVSPEVEISNGTIPTQPDGSFTIPFEAIPDLTISPSTKPVFDFRIYADVTDLNGETRSAQEVLSVGYISLLINIDIPEKLNLQTGGKYKLSTTNLNGRATPARVQVTLQKLAAPDRIFIDRLWERPDTMLIPKESFYAQFPHNSYGDDNDPSTWPVESNVFEKIVNTATDSLINLRDTGYGIRDAGLYKMILSSTDPFGQKVEKTICFTAFDPDSKQVPVPEMNWFIPLKTSGEPGETASFLIGTSEKEVQVIWEIRVKDQLASRKWLKLSNQQKCVEIPIVEEYRGNFSVNFLFVRSNRVFQNSQVVSVPYSNKNLDITFASFRNKLIPGQKEEWTIRITDADKQGAEAEFLTAMYDRSLDIFRSNSWTFDLFRRYYFNNPWDVQDDFRTTGGSWVAPWPAGWIFHTRPEASLNWFGLNLMGYSYSMDSGMKAGRQELAAVPQGDISASKMEAPEQEQLAPESQNIPVFPLRKDFRETAFFYPSLVTDSTGSLLLAFTVPDALTSWKLLGLAYTKRLDYGLIEKELITQKELMVFPNAPRFLRQGDTLVFITRIVNLSDREISGEVMLNLTEAITLQPLNSLILDTGYGIRDTGYVNPESSIAHRVSFTIPAGLSTSVSWTLAVPVSKFLSLLQYQVRAQAGSFSDGEEHVIPILPNRMLVTESMPIPVRGKGTFDFTFDKLLVSGKDPKSTLSSYRLTLEFASNPAWYAVQALPSLNEVIYKNADQIFAAFYANCLASHIAGYNPKIRQVFESWKALTPDALLSELERNEDLKSAVLQETPWVMDAKSETENRRKLGQFFDLNNLQNNFRENLGKLIKMQVPSGGWPWFEGMPESRIITLNILTGLGRLDHLGVRYIQHDEQFSNMVRRAIQYLDKELINDYEQAKKSTPGKLDENHLSPVQVKYLYTRSFFNFPPAENRYEEAFQYYRNQVAKYWLTLDLSSQALAALALHRLGDKTVPLQILKSFSERAIHSPELGMYWATRNGYEWYQAPIETQAVLIEAFDEIAQDQLSVEEMKVWLLKQKQTQMWRTKQGTVDACYALLLRGADLLAGDPEVTIRLGTLEVDPDKLTDIRQEAGTGYFRMSWTGDAVKPEMGQVQVTKNTEGIAWGGLYWQYFENLDQITSQQTPLKVEKQLFLEKNTASGPVLEPIPKDEGRGTRDEGRKTINTETHQLTNSPAPLVKVGDKIKVRIVLMVDRNMEFVHMKDMRAAGLEPHPLPPPQLGRGSAGDGLSGYRYQDGLGYYQSTTDVATNFFFDYLPKGTYVFEYPLVVNNAGDFSTGITTVQCMYAPEFSAHSEGGRIEVR
ncbi:MAG: alpha-2-macroglobulin family protein [bacterium]